MQPNNFRLTDVTGKYDNCPVCPVHKTVALIPEKHPGMSFDTTVWFYRCPVNQRCYYYLNPLNPPSM